MQEVEQVTGADASLDEELDTEVEAVEADAEADEPEVEGGEPESESDSPPDVEENDDEKTKNEAASKNIQKRFDELTYRRREAERRAEEAERRAQELEAKLSQVNEPIKTLADFEYDDKQYASYLIEQAASRAELNAQRALATELSNRKTDAVIEEFRAREESFSVEVKDYNDVVYNDKLAISDAMAMEIRNSDLGPEVAYYLGKHPKLAEEIAQMPERDVIRRIARLEDQLRAEKSKAKSAKVSKAPPPPSKLKAAEPAIKINPDSPESDKLSDAEWFRREEARLAKLRR